jgi:phosphate transport system substrate-binding protein
MTTGRISVVCASEAAPVIEKERSAFVDLYPQASLGVTRGRSSEGVRALFAAECDLAVLSRELTPEERGAAVRGRLELEGYRFAKDAVVVIVHPSCPVENLALDVLKGIYEGRIVNWSELGAPAGAIVPVFPSPESDLGDFFVERVMQGEPVRAHVLVATGDSAVVATVASRPGAIGFVSLAWADRGAKTLRLSSLTGLPYWKPDLEAVYEGDYPLSRTLAFYLRASGPRLAHGFVTYVTSLDGQQIVHESGLVPTSVPVRFVRRSPLRGAH